MGVVLHSQIQKLAAGKFDYEVPKVKIGIDKLELDVLENTIYEGSFEIESENHIPIRGVVYSSNPRLKCITTAFSGEHAKISYEFDSTGLEESDIETGEIYLICAYGEYKVSFSAVITKYYYKADSGYIKNLSQFFELCQTSYYEAYQLFLSPYFKNLFREDHKKEKMYYEGICKSHIEIKDFDEFLVACGKKQHMLFFLMKESGLYENVKATIKECITLFKEGWGHMEITMESDCDFISLEKKVLTEEDFVGKQCDAPFYIHGEKLHAGRNYGKISIHTSFQTFSYEVCANRELFCDTVHTNSYIETEKLKVELTKLYIDYRLNKILTGEWVRKTMKHLETLMEKEPKNEWYPLLKAQTLILNKQKQDAMWLLEDWKKKYGLDDTEKHAYYNYLCVLCDTEKEFVRAKTEEIKQLYQQNRESFIILWTLLFLDEEYERNKSRKFNAIRLQVQSGNSSPILYLEAYYLMQQESYLISELDSFELRMIEWAIRNHCLSREVAIQTARIAMTKKTYSRLLHKVLLGCAEIFPEKEIISALCTFLIRNGLYGEACYKWYKLAIDQGIRLALIYEYYLMSLPVVNETTLPKVLQLYFQYNCNLDEKVKSRLLAFIIRNKEQEKAVYDGYLRIIDDFSVEQILRHHMDDDLKIIYEDFMERGMITSQVANDFCEILFMKKLVFDSYEGMSKVVVIHNQLNGEQVVPIRDGCAYVGIYTADFVLLIEDSFGNRYGLNREFQTETLLSTYKYSKSMLEIVPNNKYCLVNYFDRKTTYQTLLEEDMVKLHLLMINAGVREEFKLKLLPEIFKYYKNNYTEDFLEEYLLGLDISSLPPKEKAQAVEVLICRGLYENAYELIVKYGNRFIAPSKLISLCSFKIEKQEYESDEFLVELSYDIFKQSLYNDVILDYLLKYYCGSTKNMEEIWNAAKQFELDTYEFEERLLVQMLFTTDYIGNMEDIYDSYQKTGASSLIRQAYFSYCAYGFFVKQEEIPKHFFEYLLKTYEQEEDMSLQSGGKRSAKSFLSDICLLAFMKQLVEMQPLDVKKRKILDELLGYFMNQNMEFAFYEKIDSRLKAKHGIHDKMYIEYRAVPGKKLILNYRYDSDLEEGYRQICMEHMCHGIYVVGISVFFGESLQYYITQVEPDEEKMVSSGRRSRNDVYHEAGGSRFELINNLIVSQTLKDDAAAIKYAEQYMNREIVGKKIFKLL